MHFPCDRPRCMPAVGPACWAVSCDGLRSPVGEPARDQSGDSGNNLRVGSAPSCGCPAERQMGPPDSASQAAKTTATTPHAPAGASPARNARCRSSWPPPTGANWSTGKSPSAGTQSSQKVMGPGRLSTAPPLPRRARHRTPRTLHAPAPTSSARRFSATEASSQLSQLIQRDFAAHAQFQPVGTLPGPDRDVGHLPGDAPPVSPARVPGWPQSGVGLDATGEVTADTGARRRLPADVADPCGWRRRGSHCPQSAPKRRNSLSRCTTALTIPSFTPLEIAQSPAKVCSIH